MISANSQLQLFREELSMVERALAVGAESQLELIRLKQRIAQKEGEARSAEAFNRELEASIEQTRANFVLAARESLAVRRKEYVELEETLPVLIDRVRRSEVRAPVDGIVNRVFLNTAGAVAQPGMPLLEIIPSGEALMVEAEVRPEDVSYVSVGDVAVIKLTAFDHARYGSLTGLVITVGADSTRKADGSLWFLTEISVPENTTTNLSKKLSVLPGMVAQVEIVSRERTVWDYLTEPVTTIGDEAFREH